MFLPTSNHNAEALRGFLKLPRPPSLATSRDEQALQPPMKPSRDHATCALAGIRSARVAKLKKTYEQHAKECAQAAQLMLDPGRREVYLNLARKWSESSRLSPPLGLVWTAPTIIQARPAPGETHTGHRGRNWTLRSPRRSCSWAALSARKSQTARRPFSDLWEMGGPGSRLEIKRLNGTRDGQIRYAAPKPGRPHSGKWIAVSLLCSRRSSDFRMLLSYSV
jgi:hypothetical protein